MAKKFVPKVLRGGNMPLSKATRDLTETQVLIALTALKEGFYSKEMGLGLVLFFMDCRNLIKEASDPRLVQVAVAFRGLNLIMVRWERTQKWGVTGDELKALTTAALTVLPMYLTSTRGEGAKAYAATAQKAGSFLISKTLDKLSKPVIIKSST